MSIIRSKLINDTPTWNIKNRYRVNETVNYNGQVYQNITGKNSNPVTGSDWEVVVKKKFENYVLVSSLEDLPAAIGIDINFVANYSYFFLNDLDLQGKRIVANENTPIFATSSENVRIKSTGLAVDTALISSNYSLPIRNISFEHDTVFDLQGDGLTTAIDWIAVNIQNASSIGYISDYTNVIIKDSAFINSGDLIFDGTIGTIGFDGCLLTSNVGSTAIIVIPDTAVITRRFRIIYSAVVVGGSSNGISVDASATIPVESYILDTVNFSGIGTYLLGLDYSYNQSLFENNKGIRNTRVVSNYTMNDNPTTTPILAVNTPVKLLGTTTNIDITEKFDNTTSNRSVYKGGLERTVKVQAVLSVESGNNNQVFIYVAKNGVVINSSRAKGTTSGSGRAENIVCQSYVNVVEDDYIEIFGANASLNDVLATDMNVIIS